MTHWKWYYILLILLTKACNIKKLEDELRLILFYVEQDIHDYKRQNTAFLLVVELHDDKAVLQFMLTYTLGKKINKFLDFFVANIRYRLVHDQVTIMWFIVAMRNNLDPRRESVLEMLNLIFNKFLEAVLFSCCILYSTFIYQQEAPQTTVKLILRSFGSQLINDDSPSVVKFHLTNTH